jgi:glycosyltransferase involved in cell wall biosynthesis
MVPHRAPSPEAGSEAAAGLTFSVVVAAWHLDSKADLEACVAALGRQTLAPHEVIVVIDHNPELAAWARAALGAATVLENQYERGIVGARNTGSEQASGEVVAFTDDDAAADPDWLEHLALAFAEETTIGVGGELVPDWQGPEPRWYPPEFYWVFGCSYRGLPTELAPIRNPIGANMAVRREALEAIGGFSAGVTPRELKHGDAVVSGGHALDDTRLGIAVGRAFPGKRWLHQPAARVRHKVPSTRASFRYLLIRGFEEGEGKAALAEKVGADSGLESERRHLFVTIPRGFALGFGDLLRGDRYGPARSLALVAGVAATAAGFLVASLRGRLRRDPSPEQA